MKRSILIFLFLSLPLAQTTAQDLAPEYLDKVATKLQTINYLQHDNITDLLEVWKQAESYLREKNIYKSKKMLKAVSEKVSPTSPVQILITQRIANLHALDNEMDTYKAYQKQILSKVYQIPCPKRYWILSVIYVQFRFEASELLSLWEKDYLNTNKNNECKHTEAYLLFIKSLEAEDNFKPYVAILHLIELQKYKEQNPDFNDIDDFLLHGLTMLYYETKDYENAIVYWKQALDKISDKKNIIQALGLYNNIGVAYRNLGQAEEAILYLDSCIAMANYASSNFYSNAWKGIALDNKAQMYEKQNEYAQAIAHYKQAIEFVKASKEEKELHFLYLHAMNCYTSIDSLTQAQCYYDSLNALLDTISPLREPLFYKYYAKYSAELYGKQGHYKKAYHYYQNYIARADAQNISDADTKVQKAQGKYMMEQKEQEIALQQETIKLQKNLQVLGTIITILLVLFVVYLVYNNRQKQKLNTELAQQHQKVVYANEEISQQAEELKVANEKLQELDIFKDNMSNMIAHDIKNPLNTIIYQTDKNKIEQQDRMQIRHAGLRILNLINNMLDVYKYDKAEIPLQIQQIAPYDIATEAILEVELAAQAKNIQIHSYLKPDILLTADSELTQRIITNILHNAIKYSPNNG
ncbi:MAG: tetratricopeptide repeat-containing sensor histidine kinase [Bernardetiaceae bacterium]|nr:tetratricopeptide repeat-containing sensor histidine kinase [Bernardetiaceae bacterium]